ncbi:MAG TPA: serine hydrolase, partial [Bacteroidia bacterium]|nr:serine hydrolase [Bacteroidia bacterium]
MKSYFLRPAFCILHLLLLPGACLLAPAACQALPPDSLLVETLLRKHAAFKPFLEHPDAFKIQILYTRIDRDKDNIPHFTEYSYGLDRHTYFYCASLVKLPCAALALEKLNELHIPGLNRDTRMLSDSAGPCQKRTFTDTSAASGYPSLAQYIRRMFLISDNEAYSRCYEMLGQEYISRKLHSKGYPDAYIIQRFDPNCGTADNRITNPIDFTDEQGKLVYHQPPATCLLPPSSAEATEGKPAFSHPLGHPTAGKAYIDNNNQKIDGPKDFSNSNFLALEDITHILRSVIFPEATDSLQRFNITPDDRQFMLRYLGMLPRESDHPHYKQKDYPDSYKKYLIYGDHKNTLHLDTLRSFNIVGQSYGFMTDVAYICDYKNKVEFMLSATIYANADEV